MKTITKYVPVMFEYVTINNMVYAQLSFGEITGPPYDRTKPQKEFDTQEAAFEYAQKTNPFAEWLVIPVVKFDTFTP